MVFDRLELTDTADPRAVAQVLFDRIHEAQRVNARDHMRLRGEYLAWVEGTEAQLAAMTHDAEVLTMLQTPRYRQIHALGLAPEPMLVDREGRPWPLIRAELDFQTSILARFRDDLNRRLDRASRALGHCTVLDTNVLLHYQPPAQIVWSEVVGRSPVRLIIPLRVVEELDEKKYARRDSLASVARSILPWLEKAMGPAGAPGVIRDGVTAEVLVEPGNRRRPADADREILDTCLELTRFGTQPVTLVTGDTALLLRGQAESITTAKMPDKFRRQPPERDESAAQLSH
jgi:hypothetical protein